MRQIGLEAFAPATEGALAKLGRVLPAALRESIRTVEEVVAVEPGPWVAATSAESLIAAATAIRAQRRIRFCYRSHRKETSQREMEPYAVLHTDGRWYLIGHCRMREALRTFRLDRVAALELRPETFARPEEFDARRHLEEQMPFLQAVYRIDVWLDMPAGKARGIFAPWRIAVEEEAGGTRLRCSRDRLEMIAAMLLGTGRRIVVHAPAELRETFRQISRHAAQAAEES